jgi:hypothetical protein
VRATREADAVQRFVVQCTRAGACKYGFFLGFSFLLTEFTRSILSYQVQISNFARLAKLGSNWLKKFAGAYQLRLLFTWLDARG